MGKALTSEGVEKHLVDFGLEVEAASHTTIQSLSGGQKVKVVLGASMWLNPHILILDEPTNYLDRDGLGALTLAIKDFEGNVIAEKEADMDPKKRKKEIKAIEKQLKDNKKKGTLSQEEVWELEDKLAKLKETDA